MESKLDKFLMETVGRKRMSVSYYFPYRPNCVQFISKYLANTLNRTGIVLKVQEDDSGALFAIKFGRNGYIVVHNAGNQLCMIKFSYGICKHVRRGAMEVAWRNNRKYRNLRAEGLIEDSVEFYEKIGEAFVETMGTKDFTPRVRELVNKQQI